MKDKYYTPEIEELHPNFEYEFKSYGQGFVKTEVSETGGFFEGEKRVKYLDKEDIESLGFVHLINKSIKNHSNAFILKKSHLLYNLNYVYSENIVRIDLESLNYFE